MIRPATATLLVAAILVCTGCADSTQADSAPRIPVEEGQFGVLLARYPNLTFEKLVEETSPRNYLQGLSFDPSQVKFYDETVERLQLTDLEQQILQRQGFVSVDHGQRYSFGSLYFAVYTSDLPVLITTDSILHAMHRSYDDLLMELEQTFFTTALDEVLSSCCERNASLATSWGKTAENYRDVDLYLTVARNLLLGAGAKIDGGRMRPGVDNWNGELLVPTALEQDDKALEILHLIQSLKLQSPLRDDFTQIYGGSRSIDYSQFQPRGHYTKTAPLSRYFRAMMWLGRADTGWNVLPPDRQAGIDSDTPRELRNAVLLTQLMTTTGAIDRFRQISHIIDFLVGESDNLTVFQTAELLKQQQIDGIDDLTWSSGIERLQEAVRSSNLGAQRIRSQIILSDPGDLYQVPPPSTFQMFGQRFAIDSFVLSKVVFDSVVFNGNKVKRYMPTGVDVMVALGNDAALPLLGQEMSEFPYASNLKASQEFVGQHRPEFWRANLYNIWLDALRTLDAELTSEERLPEAMRTAAWQRKQLQTQLASWAELRHNTVLYAMQSYTSMDSCEYPTGYVEPYPQTYAKIKHFAEQAARRIAAADFTVEYGDFSELQNRQVTFFKQTAEILGRLESLARKELAGQPFTAADQHWLKQAIDIRGGGSGAPTYSGWYCQLFYGGAHRSADWEPTIVDVHTDPNSKTVLEQAVGNCNFLIVAIDNDDDRMIYVGPAYSYYEFQQPAEKRLTDPDWAQMLIKQTEPPRPAWTDAFQAPKLERHVGR